MTDQQLQQVVDRNEILNLFADYAIALASGDWPRYAGIWADTVEILVPAHIGPDVLTMTGDEFAKSIADTREQTDNRHHVQSSHHIVVDGDTATVGALQTFRFERPSAKGGRVYSGGGVQKFSLVRTTDGWRITRMEYDVTHQEGNWSVLGDLL